METEKETEKKKKKQREKEVFQFYIYKLPIDRPAAVTGMIANGRQAGAKGEGFGGAAPSPTKTPKFTIVTTATITTTTAAAAATTTERLYPLFLLLLVPVTAAGRSIGSLYI